MRVVLCGGDAHLPGAFVTRICSEEYRRGGARRFELIRKLSRKHQRTGIHFLPLNTTNSGLCHSFCLKIMYVDAGYSTAA